MKLTVVLEHRFLQLPDGSFWSNMMFPYSYWEHYLQVFDEITIVARGLPVEQPGEGYIRADGPRVQLKVIPHFHGPREYFIKRRSIGQAIRHCYDPESAYLFRIASTLSSVLERTLVAKRHPFAVEVVADPWDVFSPGATRHILRPLFRYKFYIDMRRQCGGACASAYVTARTLQRRYPPSKYGFSTHYSSVQLPNEAYRATPRKYTDALATPRLVAVGTLESYYKGQDVFLRSIQICQNDLGFYPTLKWIGDGQHRQDLQQLARHLGVHGLAEFVGKIPHGQELRAALDASDIFVLPSRQEGLPRATIEAMARGLPCIGSRVGGFSELLDENELVDANDPKQLAHKIRKFSRDPAKLTAMAARNLETSRDYHLEILQSRRIEFLTMLRNATQKFLKSC